jgi:5-methyltetrahydropteroyltriglutamate--homocysteine methyltransferase
MTIPTEPIGSIPRPLKLLEAINRLGSSHPSLEPLFDEAIRDTIEQFEATGSPVITDGEQRKYQNFATYCVEGLSNTAPDGFKLPFSAGHTRRWPRLTGGLFRFLMYGYDFIVKDEVCTCPDQAGRHFTFGPKPYVSGGKPSWLFARGIHQRFAGRA